MFSSMTSWLGVGEKGDQDMPPEDGKENKLVEKNEGKEVPNPEADKSTKNDTDSDTVTVTDSEKQVTEENENDLSAKLEDVSAKALNTAKEWGSKKTLEQHQQPPLTDSENP